MFREMRRKRQALPQEGMDAVLQKGTSGVLAIMAIPMPCRSAMFMMGKPSIFIVGKPDISSMGSAGMRRRPSA